jgi:hypothetical protein
MRKLAIIALLAISTNAKAEDTAISVYANVMAASISAATICPNVGLTKDFFKEMAFQMEMTEKDVSEASRIAVDSLNGIERIAKESGEKAWCGRVVPKLIKPIKGGELAPIYMKKGGV